MGGLVKSVVGGIFGGGSKPQAPAPAPAPVAPVTPEPAKRSEDFALREQAMGQRASAAGAMRSDNDADLLGYTAPRKRGAARTILGG